MRRIFACAACLVVLVAMVGPSVAQVIDMATVNDAGEPATPAWDPKYGYFHRALSADGRYVIFETIAANLAANDTNGVQDVYIRDRTLGTTKCVSVDMGGVPVGGKWASLSPDGRNVLFHSSAGGITIEDTAGIGSVFVRDMDAGASILVTKSPFTNEPGDGCVGYDISAGGQHVVFYTDNTEFLDDDKNGDTTDIFLWHRSSRAIEPVSNNWAGEQPNGDCYEPTISADGRYVCFWTVATNLDPLDDATRTDIYVRDLQGKLTWVTRPPTGATQEGGASSLISRNGRYVTFQSANQYIAGKNTGWRYDMGTGTYDHISNWATYSSISGDGRFCAWQSDRSDIVTPDTNGKIDIFVKDMTLGTITIASMDTTGAQTSHDCQKPCLSDDGRFVGFESIDPDLLEGKDFGGGQKVYIAKNPSLPSTPILWWAGTSGYEQDGVKPDIGEPTTPFTFRVKYYDSDGDNPTMVRLRVQKLQPDQTWELTKSVNLTRFKGKPATGAIYTGTTTLPNAVYRHKFQAADADGTATGIATDWSQGPQITGTPFLAWSQNTGYGTDGVNPDAGAVGGDFTFKVVYSDSRGNIPRRARLIIRKDNVPWAKLNMTPRTGEYCHGMTYRKVVTLGSDGAYKYRFEFSDTSGLATGEPTAWKRMAPLTSGTLSNAQVTALSAVPTRAGGAELRFTLLSAADVQARVLNLAGRPVATICHSRPCEAGATTLVWSGASREGPGVPSGTYLVEVTANTEEGGSARRIAPVRLAR